MNSGFWISLHPLRYLAFFALLRALRFSGNYQDSLILRGVRELRKVRKDFYMSEKKFKWHKVAEHINELDFAENNIAVADLDNKQVCIAKHKDACFAFAYKCPHAGGILADGHIDAIGNVVCPVHRYKYSIANGRNTSGEGYFMKTYPVEIREDGVYVGVEKTGFWGF